MDDLNVLKIARRLVQLGDQKGACRAYALFLHQAEDKISDGVMEAALCNLQLGGDYKTSYDCFLRLYRQSDYRENCFHILTKAFYEPNLRTLKSRYNQNCKILKNYPYLFRKDFPAFEELPIRFYPYDDNGYCPFFVKEERFDEYINFDNPVISRNFFRDLEKPVLAVDVYSQHELEYLNDNVRKSEWVGRENHIYLHYTDWDVFCSHLQCLNFKKILSDKKIVFLVGDEISQYPIDFKERFKIDYSKYPIKPVGIREFNRLIWHTQLSAHNGGDFFNEIFDAHPNLLFMSSIMFDSVDELFDKYEELLGLLNNVGEALEYFKGYPSALVEEFYHLKKRTRKDMLVFLFLKNAKVASCLDPTSRIAPVLFFQPHFRNIDYSINVFEENHAVLSSVQYDRISRSPMVSEFKYIKTFTPVRRFTSSYAASVRFGYSLILSEDDHSRAMPDFFLHRLLNRSFMIDPQDSLFKDSVSVRFEDGKLNPKAVFTALAAFLDIPYTDSMTRCTFAGKEDPSTLGFDPSTVYRTYDEYTNDTERYLFEYFLRDAYKYYGYDFQWYDGAEIDEARMETLIAGCTTIDHYIRESHLKMYQEDQEAGEISMEISPEDLTEDYIKNVHEKRGKCAKILSQQFNFCNKSGESLVMMPKLELDPTLLEQPLYH